jgi:TolA-binding protein
MKRSFLVTIFVAFLPFNLISAEPSAFGAGDLSNPKPYGLTTSEEVVLQNKQKLQKVVVNTNNQANRVDSLRERIDGLQTIIESLSRKSQENKVKLQKLEEKNIEELNSSNEYEKRLSEVSQSNSQNIESLKLVVSEMSLLLDTINKTHVTKEEFNTLVNDVNKFKGLVAKELKKSSSSKKSKLSNKSNADIAKQAYAYYKKKYYTKAIENYTYLIEKNYKPAHAHYMIGEMKYRRKNYADAIAYFKKSASLYSKASYMPDLMLHTARSMQLTGDKKNAKSFYNALVAKYPKTSQAKSAKKYLSSMK